jgi:uncharacterized Zn-finger protein
MDLKLIESSQSHSSNLNQPATPPTKSPAQKVFICSYCEKTMSSKYILKEHEYIHSGLKPYICSFPECKANFRLHSQLSNHRKKHKSAKKSSDEIEQNNKSFEMDSSLKLPPITGRKVFSAVPNIFTMIREKKMRNN